MNKVIKCGLLVSLICMQSTLIQAIFVQNLTSDPGVDYNVSFEFNDPESGEKEDGKTLSKRTKILKLPDVLKPGMSVDLYKSFKGMGIFNDFSQVLLLKRLPFRVIFTPLEKEKGTGSEVVIDIDPEVDLINPSWESWPSACAYEKYNSIKGKLCKISGIFGIVRSNKSGIWRTEVIEGLEPEEISRRMEKYGSISGR